MSKDVKGLIKEVREHIKNGRNEEAIEKCKCVLNVDANHYMACLLIGAAYQNVKNFNDAAHYLRLAIKNSSGAPALALQGLSNCAPAEERPKIYEQLLSYMPEKYATFYEKLSALASEQSVREECIKILANEAAKQTADRQELAYKCLAQSFVLYCESLDVAVEQDLLQNALEVMLNDEEHELWLSASKRYLKLLYKNGNLHKCIERALKVIVKYPEDIYAYEWICKIYTENYTNTTQCWLQQLQQDIGQYAETLLKLNEKSNLGFLVKAIQFYQKEQFVAARELLYKAQETCADDILTTELLARSEMCIGAWRLAATLWQKLGNQFEQEYALCLSQDTQPTALQKAVDILQKLSANSTNTYALARCFKSLGQPEMLKTLELPILARAEYELPAVEALQMLASETSFESLLLRGKLLIKRQNWPEALVVVLKATQLRSYFCECYFYLGCIYAQLEDAVRTQKCYEKCVNLNPLHDEAVHNLSVFYQQSGQEELNSRLLLKTVKHFNNDERSRHILYRLGLHYLSVKNYDEAIHSFRHALKYDAHCVTYMQSLGDTYAERGSYNSAIRTFQKVLETDPENIYCKLQIALINKTIRNYNEAITEFESLLEKQQNYLPGLKGVAEAHIGLANDTKANKLYGRCKVHLQQAINYLQRAFLCVKDHNMVWLWHLSASVFLQTAQLPTSLANLDVSGQLARQNLPQVRLTRKELFKLAQRFFTCALNIKQNTFLWYNLAHCAYLTAVQLPDEAKQHLDLAIKAAKMAINEQRARWQNWNLLGVIHMHDSIKDLKLAQHCFIQAVTLERKSYISWTNLGVLYLTLHEIKLANQAFQRAQQSSPVYAQAWIGQAMIAESIDEGEEALDLFRHCQQFDYHPEAALGYAHWVCTELSNVDTCELPHKQQAIYRMRADVVAFDAIQWYTRNEETQSLVSALTFKGFLSERQLLFDIAEQAYIQAAQSADSSEQRDKVLTNLGYLYLKKSKPQQAIDAFNAVSQANFKPIIGLAMAHALSAQYQESYSVYSSVLKSVANSNEDEAAQILVAMAAMVYKFQGEDDTKTMLYQCILLEDSPVAALYAACALGILHKDTQLIDTILTALGKFERTLEYVADIAFLKSQHLLSIGKKHTALVYICSCVHMFPHCIELRKVLADFLSCHYESVYNYSTSQLALSVIEMVHRSRNSRKTCKSVDDAQYLLVAARALQQSQHKTALNLIQRAIRLQPQDLRLRAHLTEMLA